MSRRHQGEQTYDCSFPRFVFLFSTRNHWKFLVPSFYPPSVLHVFSIRNPTRYPSSDLSALYQRRMAFSSQRAATRATTVSHIAQFASSFADAINKFSIRGFARSIDCKPFCLINSFPNGENFYR